MEVDDFDQSSIHDNPQLSRQNGLPLNGSEELDDALRNSRDRDTASHVESVKHTTGDGEGSSQFAAVKHRRTGSAASESTESVLQRLLALERRLASLTNHEDDTSILGKMPRSDARTELSSIYENGIGDSAGQQRIVPQWCERTWLDFMNKQTSEATEYAIEILLDDPDYYWQKTATTKTDKKQRKVRGITEMPISKPSPSTAGKSGAQASVPNRIRINSPQILKTLKSFDENIDETASLVMLRPFKFLVHYNTQIKDAIRNLESQLVGGDSSDNTPGGSAEMNPFDEPSVLTDQGAVRQELHDHMRCLERFMDQYITPVVARIRHTNNHQVKFTELWYIFEPGDDMYMPLQVQETTDNSGTITPETFHSRYNQLWRVTGVSGGRRNLHTAQSNRNAGLKPNPFRVDCYFIDFHGRYFRPTCHTFEIAPFKGEQAITSLDFFPLRYMEATQKLQTLQAETERGKMIYNAMAHSFTHFYYSGPTLMVHPCGCPLKEGPSLQEHIESEVIIDFKMTLRKHPAWAPPREPWKDPVIVQAELHETFPVQSWTHSGRTKLVSSEFDFVYNDYIIDREKANLFRTNEQIFQPIPSGWLSNESMFPEKDIMLLPSRVFGYNLRSRNFVPLWLWALQPIQAKQEGIDNLQLKQNSLKDTLQALVKAHFMQKQTQQPASKFDYDIVRGKNRGLIMLLYGPPGTGKTLTAESVAASIGQPLLQVTCGDLGLDPKEVDSALRELFHFAAHWKCVLLLDECDVFLTRRDKQDVQRNALVSIFLRVLEFYTGVLFLTTNRLGVIDEAIRSRITWTSYYPPLNWPQTREIWKTNIKKVEKDNNLNVDRNSIMKYAKQQYKAAFDEKAVWNGRRIQNCFKVVTSLAQWDAYSKEEKDQMKQLSTAHDDVQRRATLSIDHFKAYASGTRAFDGYMEQATGHTDADRAYNSMERYDDFEEDDGAITPVMSHGYEKNLPTFMPPYDELRRTASTSAAPLSKNGRASSPMLRPPLSPRLSSSQLLHHHHSGILSPGTNGNSMQQPQPRRRSSQLTSPTGAGLKRRPSREHRESFDHELMRRHSHSEVDETGMETEETDYLDESGLDEHSGLED